MSATMQYDVIVIGGGPAGLTAGIYLSRAKLNTLILNMGVAGGQMILTHEIANYPGVESTSGYKLASVMKKQAQSFGATIKTISVQPEIKEEGNMKIVRVGDAVYSAYTVILAPGGAPRMLGVKGEQEFKGLGVSYCATCDGEFFSGKDIFVVGGGNSALEESVSLAKYANKITIVHQFDSFQAFPAYVDEAKNNPKIDFIMEAELREFAGDGKLERVLLHHKKSGKEEWFNAGGAFVFIGYQPNTAFLKDIIPLNERGEIVVNADMETAVPGIYAAGDSIAKKYRQVTTAVGEATIAALAAASRTWELKK
ncbi:MAG TPA: pyridine nucleotide-disulfide oxidoreductase [Bacteroidales bacterium]|nr:pyridine nucleotide-disulfide oxidoreductase [Bacteroidales bacterium]HCB61691.1 pyridine nucleotide-disulfide oxidoreductase [Bacteroidales bacterium]HCY22067.1 pyridine nucleotide-disulfide oxidoreductase [Bacteroidales bacterium]